MSSVIVSSKYQVVIPVMYRKSMDLKPGDRVTWFDPGNGTLQLVRTMSWQESAGLLEGHDVEPFVREKDYDGGEFT